MDAHSISYTTPSRRASSRIYQDLASCRLLNQTSTDARFNQGDMSSNSKTRTPCPSKSPRICVIGAGISGLRCADVLLQRGFDVTILEARDRIGGRTHQIALSSGHVVDLGPVILIHGTDHNPILDLAKETKTETHTWDDIVNVFGENGALLEDGRSLSDAMWGIIGQAFKHSTKNTATIDSQESLHDFFQKMVPEVFLDDCNSDEKRKIVMQMSELWGAFVGSPVAKQSLKFFWLEECIDGENLFCAGTYEKILARIAKTALDSDTVKLSMKATRIETIITSIRVFGDNGFEEEFDEVVVTAPLGWLKKNKTAFYPPLADRFSLAIDSIGYGSLEKIYITFPRAFWLNGGTDPSKEQFTGFTQWLAPSYALDTNPHRWNQESVDMSTLPEPCAHPTLLFYVYGDQSVSLCNDLAALPTQLDRDEHLTKFFKPYFSAMPNYSEHSQDCKPVSCFATSWVLDEFAGYGSYSTFRTGLDEADTDIEIMREGLPDRGLWFAGEHTSPFVALGTVTGAYWSGEAVGKRIAEAYQMTAGNGESLNGIDDIVSSDGAKEVNIRGFGDKALEK